jgi:hypothetical protein
LGFFVAVLAGTAGGCEGTSRFGFSGHQGLQIRVKFAAWLVAATATIRWT